jgi:hypothetical protein
MGELHQPKSFEEMTQMLRDACTRGELGFVKHLSQMLLETKG